MSNDQSAPVIFDEWKPDQPPGSSARWWTHPAVVAGAVSAVVTMLMRLAADSGPALIAQPAANPVRSEPADIDTVNASLVGIEQRLRKFDLELKQLAAQQAAPPVAPAVQPPAAPKPVPAATVPTNVPAAPMPAQVVAVPPALLQQIARIEQQVIALEKAQTTLTTDTAALKQSLEQHTVLLLAADQNVKNYIIQTDRKLNEASTNVKIVFTQLFQADRSTSASISAMSSELDALSREVSSLRSRSR